MILIGDALKMLERLPSDSCRTCITSPPYYGLRDYGMDGQIGLDETPEIFIRRLVAIFREVHRVLASDGTLWVNIADSYAGRNKGGAKNSDNAGNYLQGTNRGMVGQDATTKVTWGDCKPKDLVGIPWMLAFALRNDGWYLRQEIIWHKPNPMPESIKDRCTKSHESLFLLSKQPLYYFDYEAIQEPAVGFDKNPPNGSAGAFGPAQQGRRKGNAKTFRGGGAYTRGQSFINSTDIKRESWGNAENETGLRNKRDVWTVATSGFRGAHYATFPSALIRPCILAGSAMGDTVLDPFAGSGTTGVVAAQEGRNYVLIDLDPQNGKMAQRRIISEGHKQLTFA